MLVVLETQSPCESQSIALASLRLSSVCRHGTCLAACLVNTAGGIASVGARFMTLLPPFGKFSCTGAGTCSCRFVAPTHDLARSASLILEPSSLLQRARTALLLMNCIAIVGYASFPLMPPRLVPDCETKYGGCDADYHFVDTMETLGGTWSWRSSNLEKARLCVCCSYNALGLTIQTVHSAAVLPQYCVGRICSARLHLTLPGLYLDLPCQNGLTSLDSALLQVSNHYAAMPSMHFGYALWVCTALAALLRGGPLHPRSLCGQRAVLAIVGLYPASVLFCIVVRVMKARSSVSWRPSVLLLTIVGLCPRLCPLLHCGAYQLCRSPELSAKVFEERCDLVFKNNKAQLPLRTSPASSVHMTHTNEHAIRACNTARYEGPAQALQTEGLQRLLLHM